MSVNLAVPFFSQRENEYTWYYKYENQITDDETGEILHKKGEKVLEKVKNDKGEDITQEITEPV